MKPMTHVTDQKYVKAMAHPLRLAILGALEHRTASPSELADELDAPLGNVSYHVRQLHGLGLLKLVKETPRRGAVEHYYRLETRPQISDQAWANTPPIVKEAMLGGVLSRIAQQVNAGVEAGGFDRAETRVSRLPLTFDDEGFKEAAAEYADFVERLRRIEDKSRERLTAGDHDGELAALAVLMLFEADEASGASPDGSGSKRGHRASEALAAD